MRDKIPVERVKTELEIEEHLSMQERGWRVQTIGMYFIFAMVVAAAAGLYGDGVISKKRVTKNATVIEHALLPISGPHGIEGEIKQLKQHEWSYCCISRKIS